MTVKELADWSTKKCQSPEHQEMLKSKEATDAYNKGWADCLECIMLMNGVKPSTNDEEL